MNKDHFRFSTEILIRLGEELTGSLDQRILELVKNSYDADATTCFIQLIRNGNEYSIKFIDDGIGMDKEQIQNGWLVLGASSKGKHQTTKLGRVPAGSKGLGRLAALRMGDSVELKSYPKSNKSQEFSLKINWKDFDNATLVEDVELYIETDERKNREISGTEITIKQIPENIQKIEVQRLVRSLILLSSPFDDDPNSFTPILEVPEYKDLESLLKKKYFEDADFHLVSSVDDEGIASAKVVDWKGQTLFEADHKTLRGEKGEKYACPPAKFDLWAFILSDSKFSPKSVTIKEVREWLKAFGGVHLYENNLRVDPYGNEGNDWLDMNLLRVKSPEEAPGTNTSIGRVMVSETENLLIQKTDRSGFIESDEFLDLREFARDSLKWMQKKRLEVAEKRRQQERANAPKDSAKAKVKLESIINSLPKKSRETVEKAFKDNEKAKDKEIKGLKKEVQLYRTLSTAGITAATFSHESSGNPLKLINQALNTVVRRNKTNNQIFYTNKIKPPIDIIKKSLKSLKVLGVFTLQLLEQQKRRLSRININEVIKSILATFEPFLVGRDVFIKEDLCAGNPFFRGSEAAMESIITNLINNSLAAFERQGVGERIIKISTAVLDDWAILNVEDNGPGFKDIDLNDIWLPGETTQPNGTGLGLTIVKDSVSDLNGVVEASNSIELGGAKIIIKIPILGS